jgi:hypothetical protein
MHKILSSWHYWQARVPEPLMSSFDYNELTAGYYSQRTASLPHVQQGDWGSIRGVRNRNFSSPQFSDCFGAHRPPPPIRWLPGALPLRNKSTGSKADFSPPCSGRVKNAWSYTSTTSWRGAKLWTGSILRIVGRNFQNYTCASCNNKNYLFGTLNQCTIFQKAIPTCHVTPCFNLNYRQWPVNVGRGRRLVTYWCSEKCINRLCGWSARPFMLQQAVQRI